MTARRGPGRPQRVGRPRGIEALYLDGMALRYDRTPRTRETRAWVLRAKWEPFLARRGVDSEAVTIHDFVAYENELVAEVCTRGDLTNLRLLRGFYKFLGAECPDSKWSRLAGELAARPYPATVGRKHPYKPLPLRAIPRALDAARHVVQMGPGGVHIYNEAPVLVGTCIYTGGRAQFYGLRTKQVEEAIDNGGSLELFVKKGEEVMLPVHDKLLAIWKAHLDERDFDGPMFFRRGKDPYTYQDGGDWEEDARAAGANNRSVTRLLHNNTKTLHRRPEGTVDYWLRKLHGIDEDLSSHRFRTSLTTYYEGYGVLEMERRLQMSHGAKTQTRDYSRANVLDFQRKLSKTIDLGSIEWVDAHDPPTNIWGANEVVEELRRQLADEKARADRLETKLDQVLALVSALDSRANGAALLAPAKGRVV